MPFPNVHSATQLDPSGFVRFVHRRRKDWPDGINQICGVKADGSEEIQRVDFDAEKFLLSDAVKWLGEQKMKADAIEQATAEDKATGAQVRFDELADSGARARHVRRWDLAELASPTRTKEGFLRAQGMLTRSGVFPYRRLDGTIRRELRPAEEVFRGDSLKSFALVPLTLGHPPDNLTPETAHQFAVGSVGHPERSGTHVRADMLVTRKDALEAIAAGRNKLSCGYDCFVIDRAGVYVGADGKEERFDAVQTMIRGNHVAIVDSARAGPSAQIRIDESDAYADDGQEEKTVEIKINGKTFDVPDALAAKMRADGVLEAPSNAELERLRGENEALKAQAKKDAEDKAKQAAASGDEKKINDRISLIARAAPILEKKADELLKLTDAEIIRAVVAKALPDLKLEGKSDEFILGVFETALANVKKIDTSSAINSLIGPKPAEQKDGGDFRKVVQDLHAAAEKRRADAWKPAWMLEQERAASAGK